MAPRRRVPQQEDNRAHLLGAALRAFARKGYEGTTIRDIAAEAQVASGLLYHYFPSKQALLLALFEQSAALVMQAFADAAGVSDPRARLVALLAASAQLVREHEDFWRLSYGVRFQRGALEQLTSGVEQQSAVWLTLFTALLGELGRPEPALDAHLLFATLDGVFQHYVLDPERYPLDEVIGRIVVQFAGPDASEAS
jgi:AcrR family transcriptional regulator